MAECLLPSPENYHQPPVTRAFSTNVPPGPASMPRFPLFIGVVCAPNFLPETSKVWVEIPGVDNLPDVVSRQSGWLGRADLQPRRKVAAFNTTPVEPCRCRGSTEDCTEAGEKHIQIFPSASDISRNRSNHCTCTDSISVGLAGVRTVLTVSRPVDRSPGLNNTSQNSQGVTGKRGRGERRAARAR